MAFVDRLDGSEVTLEDGFDGHFFNVSMAVGSGAPNRRDDVMLVQYLLRSIYSHSANFEPPIERPNGRDMEIDGRFGQTTSKWITHFQREVRNRRGVPIRADGRVDKSDSGGISSISQTVYTIIALNKGLQIANPEAFADPVNDPDCPAELLRALGNFVIDIDGPNPR
jgi:hypothetical protein